MIFIRHCQFSWYHKDTYTELKEFGKLEKEDSKSARYPTCVGRHIPKGGIMWQVCDFELSWNEKGSRYVFLCRNHLGEIPFSSGFLAALYAHWSVLLVLKPSRRSAISIFCHPAQSQREEKERSLLRSFDLRTSKPHFHKKSSSYFDWRFIVGNTRNLSPIPPILLSFFGYPITLT